MIRTGEGQGGGVPLPLSGGLGGPPPRKFYKIIGKWWLLSAFKKFDNCIKYAIFLQFLIVRLTNLTSCNVNGKNRLILALLQENFKEAM